MVRVVLLTLLLGIGSGYSQQITKEKRSFSAYVLLNATPEACWSVLTEKEKVENWLAPIVDIEKRKDGYYRIMKAAEDSGFIINNGMMIPIVEINDGESVAFLHTYRENEIDYTYHAKFSISPFRVAQSRVDMDLKFKFPLNEFVIPQKLLSFWENVLGRFRKTINTRSDMNWLRPWKNPSLMDLERFLGVWEGGNSQYIISKSDDRYVLMGWHGGKGDVRYYIASEIRKEGIDLVMRTRRFGKGLLTPVERTAQAANLVLNIDGDNLKFMIDNPNDPNNGNIISLSINADRLTVKNQYFKEVVDSVDLSRKK